MLLFQQPLGGRTRLALASGSDMTSLAQALPDRPALESMKRADLQKLCKVRIRIPFTVAYNDSLPSGIRRASESQV